MTVYISIDFNPSFYQKQLEGQYLFDWQDTTTKTTSASSSPKSFVLSFLFLIAHRKRRAIIRATSPTSSVSCAIWLTH
jgi:hypothetical protein